MYGNELYKFVSSDVEYLLVDCEKTQVILKLLSGQLSFLLPKETDIALLLTSRPEIVLLAGFS